MSDAVNSNPQKEDQTSNAADSNTNPGSSQDVEKDQRTKYHDSLIKLMAIQAERSARDYFKLNDPEFLETMQVRSRLRATLENNAACPEGQSGHRAENSAGCGTSQEKAAKD